MTARTIEAQKRLQLLRRSFFAPTHVLFSIMIVAAAVGTLCYKLRADGIFACQANGYHPDRYLSYCQATGFGDYDHGAFWFDLEPATADSAAAAEVLFLGNSRMQVGFSTTFTAKWFSSVPANYYLLGLIHMQYGFQQELLKKLDPNARVYVINVDGFFSPDWGYHARTVTSESEARDRYERKRLWQFAHSQICGTFPGLCADEYVVFRSRRTGVWLVGGGDRQADPVSYDPAVDSMEVERAAAVGRAFLAGLPVRPDCTILTMVPHVDAKLATAESIARAMGKELISPELDGLQTFDTSHLDLPSAELWSKAFFTIAGSEIRQCLNASLPVSSAERPTSRPLGSPGALR